MVLMYLLVVYGLGGAWVWWVLYARGTTQAVGGIVLGLVMVGLLIAQRRRSRRLRSPWEWISSRAITHAGTGGAMSRWSRDRSEKPDDPDDFEAHVGGGF
jgi:alkylation response protein AidB-like acyl-CoA dehydrogenase